MKELLRIKPIRWILKLLPHLSIVFSGMLIVFFCIDRVNKPMAFMTNEFHKLITFILSILSLGYSVFIISYQRKMERQEYERRVRAAQARRRGQAPRSVQGRPTQAPRPMQSRPATGSRSAQGRQVQSPRPMPGRHPAQRH